LKLFIITQFLGLILNNIGTFFCPTRAGSGEVLLLPEVFSVLNADKVKRDFAPVGDAKGESELRQTRMWGRLYVDGWPQTIQFMRAHFGEPPPEGPRRFVIADPVFIGR